MSFSDHLWIHQETVLSQKNEKTADTTSSCGSMQVSQFICSACRQVDPSSTLDKPV